MRRAYALRDNFRFDLALKDLRKLRELMHPSDSAIQDVKRMHNQCIKGVKELGASFPLTPLKDMEDMNPKTEAWINAYRACTEGPSKLAFLKAEATFQKLTSVFHRTSIPHCMFEDWLKVILTDFVSDEDIRWVGNFLIDIGEAHDFDSETLLTCSEVDNVRLEQICRKIKKVDVSLW